MPKTEGNEELTNALPELNKVLFLTLLLFVLCPFQGYCDINTTNNKSERTVVFPTSNSTEHSLPVFPDAVVEYVGRQRPLAPQVDTYGTPLCTRQSGDTFCENVDHYPEREIRSSITYSKEEFQELFGTMSMSARRIPGDIYEDPVCPQHARLFFPKAAVNENDQWAFVVNDVDDYVQAVMSEICDNEEMPCKYLDGALPFEHTSRCRQKYAYKRLLALHPNQKKTYTDAFRFPSCCVCYVKKPSLAVRKLDIPMEDVRYTLEIMSLNTKWPLILQETNSTIKKIVNMYSRTIFFERICKMVSQKRSFLNFLCLDVSSPISGVEINVVKCLLASQIVYVQITLNVTERTYD